MPSRPRYSVPAGTENPPEAGTGACRLDCRSGPAGYGPPALAIVATCCRRVRAGGSGVIKEARVGASRGAESGDIRHMATRGRQPGEPPPGDAAQLLGGVGPLLLGFVPQPIPDSGQQPVQRLLGGQAV